MKEQVRPRFVWINKTKTQRGNDMFKFLFDRKKTINHSCSARDLVTIKRYIADGFKVVFHGCIAILTKFLGA